MHTILRLAKYTLRDPVVLDVPEQGCLMGWTQPRQGGENYKATPAPSSNQLACSAGAVLPNLSACACELLLVFNSSTVPFLLHAKYH